MPRSTTTLARAALGLAFALAIGLGVAACSDDGGDDSGDGLASGTTSGSTDGSGDTDTDDTGTDGDDGTTSTTTGSTTSTSESTTTESTTTTTALAGEPWDGFADDGDVLAVLGVASDDVLNVRAGPGTDTGIVATLDPTANDLVATGRARQLSRSFWYEVDVDGVTGWVSLAFVAFEGPTDDATAEMLAAVGDAPVAETMTDLGEIVADFFGSDDPPSDIVQSVAPSVGDLGEVTYDVVGLGDDAGAGYRLHVFAEETEGGDGFVLRTVERTSYCTRGVSGEFCV